MTTKIMIKFGINFLHYHPQTGEFQVQTQRITRTNMGKNYLCLPGENIFLERRMPHEIQTSSDFGGTIDKTINSKDPAKYRKRFLSMASERKGQSSVLVERAQTIQCLRAATPTPIARAPALTARQ